MGVIRLNFDLFQLKEDPLPIGNENLEKYKQYYPNIISFNKTIRY